MSNKRGLGILTQGQPEKYYMNTHITTVQTSHWNLKYRHNILSIL